MNFFYFVFYIFLNTVFEQKKLDCNRATVSSMTRKILVCDMEYWYQYLFKIRNVSFIFQNFQKNFKNVKTN